MRSVFLATLLSMATTCMAEDLPKMSLVGTGTVTAEPDEGYVTAGVAVVAPTSAEALRQNTATMNGLYERLGALTVQKKDIRTTEFSVSEHFKPVDTGKVDNNGNPIMKSERDGFIVSNVIRVTVCDLSKFGEALDALVQDGATRVHDITFGSSKASENLDKARAAAVKDALRKAKILTEGLGIKLGPVLHVSEASGRPQVAYRAAAAADMNQESAVPISGGTLSFNVSITVVWELEDSISNSLFIEIQPGADPRPLDPPALPIKPPRHIKGPAKRPVE